MHEALFCIVIKKGLDEGKVLHRILKIRPVLHDLYTSINDLLKTYQELESSDEVTNFLAPIFKNYWEVG